MMERKKRRKKEKRLVASTYTCCFGRYLLPLLARASE
jgi:hypothetical protein